MRRVILTLGLLLLLIGLAQVEGHSVGDPHPHIVLQLHVPADEAMPDGADGGNGSSGRLEGTWVGPVTVNGTAGDAAFVEVPLPAGDVDVTSFGPEAGWPGTGDDTRVVDAEGDVWLRHTWREGAPPDGSVVEAVEVAFSLGLRFSPDATFSWHDLGERPASMRLLVPQEVEVLHEGRLFRTHHAERADGLQEYFQTQARDGFEITLRPGEAAAVDPARAVPPWAGWGWTILIGLALLSGGLWWAGHRMEEARARRENEALVGARHRHR